MASKKPIGELLVDNGLITPEQLAQVEQERLQTGERVSAVLSRLGLANESHLANALELEYGVNYVSLTKTKPDPQVLELLPVTVMVHNEVIPLSKQENRLTLAMVNPNDTSALDDVQQHLKDFRIKTVVCTEDDFQQFIEAFATAKLDATKPSEGGNGGPAHAEKAKPAATAGGADATTSSSTKNAAVSSSSSTPAVSQGNPFTASIPSIAPKAEAPKAAPAQGEEAEASGNEMVNDLRKLANHDTVVKLINQLLGQAIKKGSTHIHIEHTGKHGRVRYRTNGQLQEEKEIAASAYEAAIARLKIMSQLDLATEDQPQDSRIRVRLGDETALFRISIVPGKHGEHVVVWIN